jgi:CBS domain-containing protein
VATSSIASAANDIAPQDNASTTPQTPIKEMTLASVSTISRETSVGDVMKCFLRNASNKALVVDREEHLEGSVTVMDLVAAGADGDFKEQKE